VLAEHDANTGNVLQDYVLAGASFVAKISAAGTFYSLRDRQSERLRLDASGNVTAQMGTLPYGEDFGESGAPEKHHFTGYERDAATGDDYALTRFYTAAVGRFKSADSSIALPGDPQSCRAV
jgi:RHS repeat-associated protein